MWTNSLLKKNAWESLKSYYWIALCISFMPVLAMQAANMISQFIMQLCSGFMNFGVIFADNEDDVGFILFTVLMGMIGILLYMVVYYSAIIFLYSPLSCGQCKYFLAARNGDSNFSHLFDNFKNGNYKPTVKTMFYMQLYIALWSLLFVVPGIIKSFEYALIPYMLAENPNLNKDRAFEISKKTMDGEKWNFFVLQLSFIGWGLLGLLACCIGTYFVAPYMQATYAEFYMCMRAKMIAYGYTTEEELSGFIYDDGFGGTPSNPYYGSNTYDDSYGGGSSYASDSFTSGQDSFSSGSNPYDAEMPDIPAIPNVPDIPNDFPDSSNPNTNDNSGNSGNNPYDV